ncbi:hypothetical protein [Anaeromyxobacter paludicola]|uniref:Uncharacterized protein n=1 Tax=Anaeromyxobacter paludicola TaxID=2918171 RepID=A0ABN6N4E0_9BACT|nr:hypothetical protein [Anaeromyxobacter paludicola]BDG08051.1 hypothetical protein AMPC_11640 [Anaeromyxobacter paludicola]
MPSLAPLLAATLLAAGAPAAPAAPASGADAPAPPTRRYFLVAEQSRPEAAQYDVSVFVNSQWIREVRAGDARLVMEVTKFLHAGENRVTLEARKRPDDGPGPADATLRVVLGEGTPHGTEVAIDAPAVEMRRTAAETASFTEEYPLVAR